MQTTKEWQESVSEALYNLTNEIKKLGTTILQSIQQKPEIKEKSISDKPAIKQENDILEYDNMANEIFEKRMWMFSIINFIFSITMAVISFKFIQVMFGFWFGLSSASYFVIQMLLIDKYLLKGDSLDKVSKNAIAVVGFWFVIAFIFIFSYVIGNTLISDPARGEEHKQVNIERQYKEIDTIPSENGNSEFGNSGSSER